jgi:Uncharacterised protein family (UPF0139)
MKCFEQIRCRKFVNSGDESKIVNYLLNLFRFSYFTHKFRYFYFEEFNITNTTLATMAPNLKYAGDPRESRSIRKYSIYDFSPEEIMPDGFGLFALTFGMAGMMLKIKYLALLSVLLCLISISNSRGTEAEIKQIISSLMVAGFALFQSYIDLPVPNRQS